MRLGTVVDGPGDGSISSVRLSAFDTGAGVRPSFRQFTAYAAEWEPIPDDGLPRYPESRPTSRSACSKATGAYESR